MKGHGLAQYAIFHGMLNVVIIKYYLSQKAFSTLSTHAFYESYYLCTFATSTYLGVIRNQCSCIMHVSSRILVKLTRLDDNIKVTITETMLCRQLMHQ